MLAPGHPALPDDQGNAGTCSRHAVSKGIADALDEGIWGKTLDANQECVTQSLVNMGKDVGGCWPTIFNLETIIVHDLLTKEYYDVGMKVTKCTFPELQHHWSSSKFVVVYMTKQGLHCVYVKKIENGKLSCFNSHGNHDTNPLLMPNQVQSIYKIDASLKKTSRQNSGGSQSSMKEQALEAENKKLKAEIKRLREENKKLIKLTSGFFSFVMNLYTLTVKWFVKSN